jgi:hypothetical protein
MSLDGLLRIWLAGWDAGRALAAGPTGRAGIWSWPGQPVS